MRALRQQLESLSRAGLTHLPRSAARDVPSQSVAAGLNAPAIPVRAPRADGDEKSSRIAPAAESSPKALVQDLKEKTLPISDPGANAPRAPGSPAQRQQALDVLKDQVKECTRCTELARTRTQTVFGVGNPAARIVFIGEAPGADEDEQGEPFVGKAGKLLNQIITASRLTRPEIYICNVLKCRPPGNRTPAEDECANCREFLLGQLSTIDPEYIVCWGAVAAQNLLTTKLSIGKLRGQFTQFGRAKVLCTYHPSYLLRNPAAKKDVWQDMQFLMADMGVDLKKST